MMMEEEGKIISEHETLLGKAGLRRVLRARGGWSGELTSRRRPGGKKGGREGGEREKTPRENKAKLQSNVVSFAVWPGAGLADWMAPASLLSMFRSHLRTRSITQEKKKKEGTVGQDEQGGLLVRVCQCRMNVRVCS